MKRCIDCKFHKLDSYYGLSHCKRLHSSKTVLDPVNGGTKEINTTPLEGYRYAEDERASILPWKCGMKARYFQEQQKQMELVL